ncbi:hypothetical protein RsS62_33020 [Rhizobium dioscoreae]|uniref:Uncharacterized protein n=1 Tax=Rhizobium dioscoreae TaxID=2653122 RepID=A0ABQ0YW04_9HYPH|nr:MULTISPECIES: hypothetical protein [Rhizobium]MCZ3380501.1 hypothetical protein [Rhizobium sp. AG207R]GES44050.1 hypothetical protein RsS62_33020 [Rhizobium dioscoreae]GES47444.1 hypothetical protein RsS93_00580 [Rhizobium dioscoreae]GLU80091.1 hypothetical protein Rhsp01_12670 [Rhizobium sp. NBRC 114257]
MKWLSNVRLGTGAFDDLHESLRKPPRVLSGNMVLAAGDPPTFGIVAYMSTTDGAVQQKPTRMNI